MTPEMPEDLTPAGLPVEQPDQAVDPADMGLQELAAISFGPGHPLYHENGNPIVRGVLNVSGFVTAGLIKHLAWRERSKQRSADWSADFRQRSKAKSDGLEIERGFKRAEQDYVLELHLKAIRSNNPADRLAYLLAKQRMHSSAAQRLEDLMINLSVEKPRRYEAKVRRASELWAKQQRKAQRIGRKILKLQ